MAGPNKDLFKRALSRIATKGTAPQAPSGSPNWQGVAPTPAPPPPTAASPAPPPVTPPSTAAPAAPAPAARPSLAELREDDLIAQIEAEEEALMAIAMPAPAVAAAPVSPPAPVPPTPVVAPTPVAAAGPLPAPAPVPAPGAAAAAAARTAREAAAAMAARLSARRGGPPMGVGGRMTSEQPATTPAPGPATLATSPAAAAPEPAMPSFSAPPADAEKIPADDRRAPNGDRRSGGDRRNETEPRDDRRSAVPFAAMAPIASAERKGGVGATFVPAAGPIPFAHIGAFRWLMPTQSGTIAKAETNGAANGHDSAPLSAPPPSPAPVVAAPVATPAPPPAPAPTPVVADPVPAPVPAPAPKAPAMAPPADDFLQKLNFNDLNPSPAAALAVATADLSPALDVNGDGIVGLSDMLEPEPERPPASEEEDDDDVLPLNFDAISLSTPAPAPVPAAAPVPVAAAPVAAAVPVAAPAPVTAPAPVAAPDPAPAPFVPTPEPAPHVHASTVPGHAHGAPPAAISPAESTPLHAHVPAPVVTPTPPAAPAPAALSGSPTLAAAEVLRGTVAALGTQVRERDDIARIVLGYATQRYRRSALFVIKKEMLVGWEGTGTERAAVRGIMVPLTNPSIFKTVFETKVLYCGGVPHTTVNDIFFNALGDPRPERVVVVPFVLKDKVACVLYADGGDIDEENPASIGELYQLGRAVSSAFENLILRAKRS